MTPRPPMKMVALRVPEKLWQDAKAAAEANDEAVADVVRAALERYVRTHRRQAATKESPR